MKILIFTVLMLFLIIPQVAYGSEILAEPDKLLFDPNEWIKISIEVIGYSGGDIEWSAMLPDGTSIDGILSNFKGTKTTHSIIRNAFDGQFGTWKIQYEYNDAVKIIDVEVEQMVLSVTTDQISYLSGSTATVQFSTNFYNPSAAKAETMTIEILDDDGFSAKFVDKVKIKVYQPVTVQQFSIDKLLKHNPFGIYHAVVTYYDIIVDVPFEVPDPDSSTSIFLSSDKKLYSPNDIVEVNIVIPKIDSDSGTLSITSPSGALITKTVLITNSLTRVILDDIDTSKVGFYSLEFEYDTSSGLGSFEVYVKDQDNSNVSSLEIDITLDKPQYRPGEIILATISTNKLVNEQIIYWFEDSSGNQGNQFSFLNPTSGTFTIPHIISVDFLQGPSKLHVKYGSAETFAIFFVFGDAVTPSENVKVITYNGPEILLTIDESIVNFSKIADISISPNLELFVVDSGNSKINVFDIKGNLIRTWGTFGNEQGQLSKPVSILAEESFVHVSDAGNSRIVTFDNDGNFVREWGNSGFDYQLVQNPTDIAVDDSGIYYVSDGNQNKILKFNTNGTFAGEINSLLTSSAKFSSIDSITTNGDNIFLLSTANNRILIFYSHGGFLKSFGTEGQSDRQFQNPVSLEFADNDHLYVADSENNRVLVMNTSGDYVAKWGTFGNGPGQFYQMSGIDVDLNGDIWVADSGSNRIQKFASISDVKIGIPDWIHNNAKWWASDQITDDDFLTGIQFLVKDGILVVPFTEQSENSADEIPKWLKNNVGWWADGLITDSEFINGIQYMIKNGLIRVS